MKKLILLFFILTCFFQIANAQTSVQEYIEGRNKRLVPEKTMLEPLSKETIISLYKRLYLTSEIDTIVWNGNINRCNPGNLSAKIYIKAENRINFFRLVNGLNEVQNNPELNKDAQNAALLVKANNQLTHYPKKSMKCYTKSAANGCQKSLLGFTNWIHFPKTAFITQFIRDFGATNYFVGHRRWLLYSRLSEFGYGATNTSEAVLTVSPNNRAVRASSDYINPPKFVAYPWNGYVPVNLIYPYWSFSIPKDNEVDFSKAKISMVDAAGKQIDINVEKERNLLDHTIVWTATGLFSKDEIRYGKNNLQSKGYLNKRITVIINGVFVNGQNKEYEYFVEPILINQTL